MAASAADRWAWKLSPSRRARSSNVWRRASRFILLGLERQLLRVFSGEDLLVQLVERLLVEDGDLRRRSKKERELGVHGDVVDGTNQAVVETRRPTNVWHAELDAKWSFTLARANLHDDDRLRAHLNSLDGSGRARRLWRDVQWRRCGGV